MEDEKEKLLAKNIIWTAAGDYAFQPEFLAMNGNKTLDLYLNMVIGLVHKWYDTDKIAALFSSFDGISEQGACDALAWIALENAVYEREVPYRPVLKELREAYAGEILTRSAMLVKTLLEERINEAKCRRILGKKAVLAFDEEKLLNGLMVTEADTEQLIARITGTLNAYYHREIVGVKRGDFRLYLKHRLPFFLKFHSPVQTMIRNGEEQKQGQENGSKNAAEQLQEFTSGLMKESDAKIREKIRDYFGEPMFDLATAEKMEKSLCRGNHANCHVYFADGNGAFAVTKRHTDEAEYERLRGQEERNRSFYRAHERQYRNEILRLKNRIENVLLMEREAEEIPAAKGTLNAAKVWRASCLNERKVFKKREKSEPEDFSVTLLLDGSSSQLERQELIASEAYMIAESLRLCYIPTQVYSFCSLGSYTVCEQLKADKANNCTGIFRYRAVGFNRDGLALRCVGKRMAESGYTNQLLIVLTDASPNGGGFFPAEKSGMKKRPYAGEDGVKDTAAEVRALKKQGIHVIGLFFGQDVNVASAKEIYGRGFARIICMERLADAVGMLVQDEIQSIFR